MRKYGKYEKMPDGTRAKQPSAQSVLLQTYFTSLLSMVLCVTMFFGTTFAWFTSEVNNTANEIYIGILDVELEKKLADGKWTSLSELVNGANKTSLFDKDIRWEPGYTTLETIQVVNKGDLAFNYRLTFTDGQVDGKTDEALRKVAEWFDVWVYHNDTNEIPAHSSYAEIVAKDSGWISMGTLADALEGQPICKGQMDQEAVAAGEVAHTYTIALHMRGETVEESQQEEINALMGQKISLNVKLVASQLSSEQDAFDNNDDNHSVDGVKVVGE